MLALGHSSFLLLLDPLSLVSNTQNDITIAIIIIAIAVSRHNNNVQVETVDLFEP